MQKKNRKFVQIRKVIFQNCKQPQTIYDLMNLTGYQYFELYVALRGLKQNGYIVEGEPVGCKQKTTYVLAGKTINDISVMSNCQAIRYVKRNIKKTTEWIGRYLSADNKDYHHY